MVTDYNQHVNSEKVLLISRELFPYTFGGLAKLMYEYLKRAHNFHYRVVTWYDQNRRDEERITFIQIKPSAFFHWNRYLRASWFIIWAILKCLKKDFDIVVGMGLNGCLLSVLIGIFKRKPRLSIVYDVDMLKKGTPTYGFMGKEVRKLVFRFVSRFSSQIMCGSQKAKNDMVTLFHVPEDKVVINPPGVDTPSEIMQSMGEKKNCKFMLLSVASINPKEGFEFLIEAMRTITREVSDIKLYIVGGEVYQNYSRMLKELVLKYNLGNNVVFTGRVDSVWPYYEAADIFLAASYYEKGFSMPVIEASSLGKPVVISSYLGEVGLTKDGETGLVVPDKDPNAIAKAVIKLVKEDSLRKKMGGNGKVFAKRFSWDISTENFEDCIARILG